MKMSSVTVGILFGGRSAEHDVSVMSARTVVKHINRSIYQPELIYINRDGRWLRVSEERLADLPDNVGTGNSFLPWEGNTADAPLNHQIYFPVLHGPFGEDGRIQSLFELSNKPFVGAGSAGSALAMDKTLSKLHFKAAGLPVLDWIAWSDSDWARLLEVVRQRFSYPVFVKPASLGSSVGISRVMNDKELVAAADLAYNFDNRILVEQGIRAREIEVSVLGNDRLEVSKPGELIPGNEFYDYNDKYIDGNTQFKIPVELAESVEKRIRTMAAEAFRCLRLNGMARADFFIENGTGAVYLSELNTIPGFTEISMYPKLWQVEGLSFTDLISRLLELGFQQYEATRKIGNN